MNARTLCPRLAVTTALVGVLAIGPASAPAQFGAGSLQTIKPTGVGLVKLGKTYTKLRKQKLVGKIRPGCELGGPNTRGANLRKPLRGSVDFTLTSPRKVTNITITKGAAVRGVGIGSTIDEIQAAFPKAKVDHGTDETFGITLVKIPKSDGGKFQFAVDTTTGKTTLIGIPFIAFCE